MKTIKLMTCAFCAAVLAAFVLVGCEKTDIYSIDAPADLQRKIDSIAVITLRQKQIADSIEAAKAAALEARLTEDIYQVGLTDNSTGFWGAHSKYYRLEDNSDTVYVKFKNFTSGKNVWCNWVQAITNDVPRGGEGYLEYAIWRADNYSNYAWGTENGVGWNTSNEGDTHGTQQTTNYASMAKDNKNFAEWSNLMNGADCIALITRGGDSVYVDVQMTALSGQKLKKSFYIIENNIEDQPIRIFWTLENCHLVFYKTLTPPLDEFTPDFELDPDWNKGAVDPIIDPEPVTGATYRADITATITTAGDEVFTYTYFSEGLPYGGYSSFFIIEGGHMVFDPAETYYCPLADTANEGVWYYPYAVSTTVGLEDNTSPWWTAFSEYTTIVGEGYYHYKFVNYTSGANNWNNWCLALTNGHKRGSNSYKECFVIRADNFGWGDYHVAENITQNYRLDGPADDAWAPFREYMNGATVEMTLTVTAESQDQKKSTGISHAKTAEVNYALKPGKTLE